MQTPHPPIAAGVSRALLEWSICKAPILLVCSASFALGAPLLDDAVCVRSTSTFNSSKANASYNILVHVSLLVH